MKWLRWLILTSLMLWMGAVSATPQDILQVQQTLSKTSMGVQSCQNTSDIATVTITIQGRQTVTPIDLVVVIDRSGSEDLSKVQDAAHRLLAQLNQDDLDRVALVSFSDTARLEQGLSSDAKSTQSAIGNLSGGQLSALGDGLALALDELMQNGRVDANKGIVVLSDGGATTGLDPLAQTERAAQVKLPIYFVGITGKVNRGSLSELARRANGAFFAGAGTQSLVGVLKRLGRALLADFITIKETLPDAFTFVGVPEGGPVADIVHNSRSGTTELTWTVDTLLSGQIWQAQFEFSASQTGKFSLNRDSELSYFDGQGVRVTQPLPNPDIEIAGTPVPLPQFNLNPEQPKANQFVQFFDRSTTQGSAISAWLWDFGDGETSSEQNPVHVYKNIGSYTVSLTVTDNNCSVTYQRALRISEVVPGTLLPPMPLPVAEAEATEASSEEPGSAENGDDDLPPQAKGILLRVEAGMLHAGEDVFISLDADGTIQSCKWDFGDGSTHDGPCEVTHQYAEAGEYIISLTVTFENDEEKQTITRTITVFPTPINQRPTADFTFRPAILRPRQPVAFDSTASKDEDGTITAWAWEFGDGDSSDVPNPIHEYQRPGTYEVTLTVTDNAGDQSEAVKKEVTIGIPIQEFIQAFIQALSAGEPNLEVPKWMEFYIDGGWVTDDEIEDAARRFANGSFVQGTQYRLTESDLRALTELHDLRIITAKYLNLEDAVADGYEKTGDFTPNLGQNYVNVEILNDGKPPQFDQMPILTYMHAGDGTMVLAGVHFVAFDEEKASLFGFDTKSWPSFAPPPPRGASPGGGDTTVGGDDDDTTDESNETPPVPIAGGGPRQFHVLTVWIWRENPDGMFTPLNPEIQ